MQLLYLYTLSYHINSDKIKNVLGFIPKYTISDAIKTIAEAYRQGKIESTRPSSWSYKFNIGKNPISRIFRPDEILIDTTHPKFEKLFDKNNINSIKKYKNLEKEVIVKPIKNK